MPYYDKTYYPYPSTDKIHKYFIITSTGKKVRFGSSKNKDFTIYYREDGKEVADKKREAYIARHSKLNEDWTKSGIDSKGWWAKWLLWSEPTVEQAYTKIKAKLKKWKIIPE